MKSINKRVAFLIATVIVIISYSLAGCRLAKDSEAVKTFENTEDDTIGYLIGLYNLLLNPEKEKDVWEEQQAEQQALEAVDNSDRMYAKKDGADGWGKKYRFDIEEYVELYFDENKEETEHSNLSYTMYLNEKNVSTINPMAVYIYPIYKNQDGDVYVWLKDYKKGYVYGDGSTLLLRKNDNVTVDGKKEEYLIETDISHNVTKLTDRKESDCLDKKEDDSIELSVDFKTDTLTDKIELACMDKEGRNIETGVVEQKDLPDTLKVADGTEKIVVKYLRRDKVEKMEMLDMKDGNEKHEIVVPIKKNISGSLEVKSVELIEK